MPPRAGPPLETAGPRKLATVAMILETHSAATLALGGSEPRPSEAWRGAREVSRFWKVAKEPDETAAFKFETRTPHDHKRRQKDPPRPADSRRRANRRRNAA